MTVEQYYASLQAEGFQVIRRICAGDIGTILVRGRENEVLSIAAPENMLPDQRVDAILRFKKNYLA